MTARGLDVVLILSGPTAARDGPSAVAVDMPRLTDLDDDTAAAVVRRSVPRATRQFADALRLCDACLVYDLIFDAYLLPTTIALCEAARSTGLRLVFYSFECTWGTERRDGFDWTRSAGWPWREIGRAARDHAVAFPAAATQAKVSGITGLDLAHWRLLPPLLDPADEPHLDPETVAFWHAHDLWAGGPVIVLPALNRDNNDFGRAMRVTLALKRLGHRPRLLLTFSPSARWKGNPERFRSLGQQAMALGLEDEVIFLAAVRPAWREGLGRHALQTVYQLVDLVLLPTDWEGFGLVAVEAALARAPLLCSDLPVLREITDGEAEYFGASEDDDAVAQRALALARQPANRTRRAVARHFDVRSTYDRYLAPLLAPAERSRDGCGPASASSVRCSDDG